MHVGRLRITLPRLLLGVLSLTGLRALAQTKPVPPAPSAPTTSTPAPRRAGPLNDYVPCIFSPDQQRDMRVLPSKAGEIERRRAYELVQVGGNALSKAVSDYWAYLGTLTHGPSNTRYVTLSPEKIAAIQKEVLGQYQMQVSPESLIGMQSSTAIGMILAAAHNAWNSKIDSSAGIAAGGGGADFDKATLEALESAFKAVDSAVNQAATRGQFQAPDDVSCSMALLTWKETSDIFGRRVANTFIAIQVTVRNLNPENEFLVHDVQVAVDTGVREDAFSRFQAGRDKLLVRNVAQRGQSEDRRNLVLHSLEMAGAIFGSAAIATSGNAATAIAVFQGAFIPGYSSLFPDHTVDQLNHINDLVFSSSSSSKVIVPIQGSVPLVTFISERPVEQLPFAWCGYPAVERVQGHCGGVDPTFGLWNIDSSTPTTGPPTELPYKRWKAAALRVLAERTFVVIGGVHIKELTKDLQARLMGPECAKLPSGAVDISVLSKDGVVSCKATGTNLDTASSVLLKNDSGKIAGKLHASADGTSAELTFDPADLAGGQGVYGVFLEDKTGTDTDSGAVLRLAIQPLISVADSDKKIAFDKDTATFTVKGQHLDAILDVLLVPDTGDAVKGKPAKAAKDAAALAVEFASTGLKAGKYHLSYTLKEVPTKQVDLTSLTVDVTAPDAAPGDAKPGDAKPAATKPGDAKPGATKGGSKQAGNAPPPPAK